MYYLKLNKTYLLELQCQSNIRKSGILVGENDCPVTPETFGRFCSFSYVGNYDVPLNFLWMKKVSSTIVRHKVMLGNLVESDVGRKISSVEDSVQVSNDMDKAIFECRLEGEEQIHSCKLPQISVQCEFNIYKIFLFTCQIWWFNLDGKNKLEENPQLHSTNLKNVNCSVEQSKNLECSYSWEAFNKFMKHQISMQSLPKEHLSTHCLYKCQARCNFVTGESCQFIGSSLDFCHNTAGIGEGN